MSRAEAQLLAAISEAGFPVPSVAAIRDQYSPLPSGLAALLLEWIPRLEDRRLQESVAWALLAARSGTLDGAALAELFDAATNDELKRAIASVINQTRPRNIDEWLIAAVRDRRSGDSRNLLAAAVAKMLLPERAVPVLLDVFRDAALAAVHPLGKVGDSGVRDVLAAALPTATGPLRRELRQAIARIERRLAKAE
ncbi:MAG: hypothetical protein DWI21_04555 [Planctomycetota bacterium]|nr:MAG: hypothetical protein DWI21_04555 [Planctomycetota bacterium]GDY09644.1 hypothetical protein LBMAG52_31300 [Planctomycetia bacterium]